MTTLSLAWQKSLSGSDFTLRELDLTRIKSVGVYVIWYPGNPSKVVRVGQGDIAYRLLEHRNNWQIMQYERVGSLRTTWAAVPQQYLDGVELYLAQTYSPLVGDRFPDVLPVAVNSPW